VLVKRLTSPPMNVPASLVSTAKLFVNILRVERGGRVSRRVTRVHESRGYEPSTDTINLAEIVVWDPDRDIWRLTSDKIELLKIVADLRLTTYEKAYEDVLRRATVLDWLAKKNADVTMLHTVTRLYERDPDAVYNEALKEVKRFEPP